MDHFNDEHDKILISFEKQAKALEEDIKKRQIIEMDELYQEFEEKYSLNEKKYSKEVIELKATEEKMVKAQM